MDDAGIAIKLETDWDAETSKPHVEKTEHTLGRELESLNGIEGRRVNEIYDCKRLEARWTGLIFGDRERVCGQSCEKIFYKD